MMIRPGNTVLQVGEFAVCERVREARWHGEDVQGFCLAGPGTDPYWHFSSVDQAKEAIHVLQSEAWRTWHRVD